jgi:rare lipoprotein A
MMRLVVSPTRSSFIAQFTFVIFICVALPVFQGCSVLREAAETSAATNTPSPAHPPLSQEPAKAPAKESSTSKPKLPQTGEASWYGAKFDGKKTARGDVYDQTEFTAAHSSLPFGTKVKVTNLANGKSVEVEITDRGPHAENRIIDLSHAAAQALDMKEKGTTKVRVEPLPDRQSN